MNQSKKDADDSERRPTDKNKAKDVGRNAKLPLCEHSVLKLFIESENGIAVTGAPLKNDT